MHKTLKSRVVTIAGQIVGPLHVRFGSKADVCSALAHVCFVPKADMLIIRSRRQSAQAVVVAD